MALINQNSIIGVTSITSPSSSNVLTVHANDTTERLRISETGLSFSGTNSSLDTSGNATLTPWTNFHVVGSNVANGVNARNNSNPTGQLHVSSSGWGINQG